MLAPLYGVRFRLQTKPDRYILENVIFGALLADEDIHRLLFVGCASYTRSYSSYFVDREFWTIDVDERMARHGGPRHIVGSITEMSRHFPPGSLDVVICNGVIGFGLDTEEECDRAFRECYVCLRSGGLLIVGWDNVDEFRPFPLQNLTSLRFFRPYALPPFVSWRYQTFSQLQHTYDFYRRP